MEGEAGRRRVLLREDEAQQDSQCSSSLAIAELLAPGGAAALVEDGCGIEAKPTATGPWCSRGTTGSAWVEGGGLPAGGGETPSRSPKITGV